MSRPIHPLGDSHNFGRRVSLYRDRIRKPRTLVWEQLLLTKKSPLRRLLDVAAERDGLGRDAFGFLPDLKFHPACDPQAGGEVERVRLEPLRTRSADGRRALAQTAGRSLALWSWLGISDLHWENLVLGVDKRGAVVFAPLDIEMILADLSLPTQTKLLPDADPEYADVCRHASGIRRLLPFLGKPVDADVLLAVASAYHSTLGFLHDHARELAATFAQLPGLREAPIRVCVRGTETYVRARAEPVWPPLLEAESEQLMRGDIPYFFRFYGRAGIHYYADPELKKLKKIPSRGDVPQLDPLLSVSRGLRSPSRRALREQGLFTVLAAFDHVSLSGTHKNDKMEIKFGSRFFTVRLPSGEELRSPRNLSAVVGSVYLPCRCGEVSTVFVPAVTACDASRAAVTTMEYA